MLSLSWLQQSVGLRCILHLLLFLSLFSLSSPETLTGLANFGSEILSWHSVIAFLATLVRCCTTSQRNQSPVSHRQEATQDNDRPLTSATSPASSSRSERKDLELEQDGGAEDLFEFVLIPRALIISTLTPLLLLLLNFIWRSEGDAAWNSGSPADEGTVASMSATQCGSNILCHSVFGFAAQTDFSIDWVARTLIGGVSGGVALGGELLSSSWPMSRISLSVTDLGSFPQCFFPIIPGPPC